jgi:Zinc carboxypeptidase
MPPHPPVRAIPAEPLTQHQMQLKHLVDNGNIRIMPMVNPDGNRRTVTPRPRKGGQTDATSSTDPSR